MKRLSWLAPSVTVISCPIPLGSTLLALGEVERKCLLKSPTGSRRNGKGRKAKAPRTAGHPV